MYLEVELIEVQELGAKYKWEAIASLIWPIAPQSAELIRMTLVFVSRTQISAAVHVNGLAGDVTRARGGEEAHGRGDVVGMGASAKSRAIARPILRAPPVTIATRPSSSFPFAMVEFHPRYALKAAAD
jgi:hypothetical protein